MSLENHKYSEYQLSSIMIPWHHFIYLKDHNKRETLLQQLTAQYPMKFDGNEPIAIQVKADILPEIENQNSLDKFKIRFLNGEYLAFLIYNGILTAASNCLEANEQAQLFDTTLIAELVRQTANELPNNISNMKDLIEFFSNLEQETANNYSHYVKHGELLMTPSLMTGGMALEPFMRTVLKKLGDRKHFSVFFDQKNPYPLSLQKGVNDFIASRCTNTLTANVCCSSPNDWRSYISNNGQRIEDIHDYSIIDVDGTYHSYIKKLVESKWNN